MTYISPLIFLAKLVTKMEFLTIVIQDNRILQDSTGLKAKIKKIK